MRKCDFAAGAVCAVMSLGLILGLASPPALNAVEPPVGLIVPVNNSEIVLDGVAYSLTLAGHPKTADSIIVGADYKPQLLLVVRNTTSRSVEIAAKAALQSQSPADRVSRVLVVPTEIWSQESRELIAAGETRTFTLKPDVQLRPSTLIRGVLSVGQQTIVPVIFSVAVPAQDASVAAH